MAILGATGGCGATTLACGAALVASQSGPGPLLVGLDSLGGGPADLWGIPATRSVDDLRAVGEELGPEHVGNVVHEHRSGVAVMVGPRTPRGAAEWDGHAADMLAGLIAVGRPWIADAGRGGLPLADAFLTRASRVVVVTPCTVDGASRARRVLDQLASRTVTIAATGLPAGGTMSARALRRVLGCDEVIEFPVDHRGASDISAGRAPRRRGLAGAIARMVTAA